MKTTMLAILALYSIGPTTDPTPQSDPGPTYARCMSIPPICGPGTHPTCICESDISLSCTWLCAGR